MGDAELKVTSTRNPGAEAWARANSGATAETTETTTGEENPVAVSWTKLLQDYESAHAIRGEIDANHEVLRRLEQIFAERREAASKRDASLQRIPRFHFHRKNLEGGGQMSDTAQRLIRRIARHQFAQRTKATGLLDDDVHQMYELLATHNSGPFPDSTEVDEAFSGRINYDDFCSVRSLLPAQFARFFQADTFCKFRRDEWGRISTQLFFQYVCRHITLQQTRAQLALYDSHGDGYLREQDMENYIYELIPTLEALEDLQENFYPFYVFTAVRKFFFFLDARRMGRIALRELITSPILHELLHLQNAPQDEDIDFNWFSAHNTLRVYSQYLELDIDHNGMLNRSEIQGYGTGSLTSAFIDRVFEECLTYDGEIDYKAFLDFVLAMETKKSPQSLAYFFRLLDVRKQTYLDRFSIRFFFSEIVQRLRELDGGGVDADVVRVDDVCDEIFDMCNPKDPSRITLADLVRSGVGDTIVTMLTDLSGFWAYDNREHLIAEEAREEAEQRALAEQNELLEEQG